MKKSIVISAVLVAASAATFFYLRQRGDTTESFRFVEVSRGDVESTVSATGTLSAVRTVQVGTQVSGQIAEIRVDFNDRVRKGQLIARLETTLLQQAVRDAGATLERSQADTARRNYELRQATELFQSRTITETELRTAQYNATSAITTLRSAEAGVERARQNLGYAYIYAPVNGTVIERNVDVGQTVAASFSAPQLFLIAEDLGRMQILASVSESDIGQITEGMEARFTVQAYPNEAFTGKVKQVRLQSERSENVVNYAVAVEVGNKDGKLLPGMTATVSFIADAVHDVLRVPNAALRFRPSEKLLANAVRDTVIPGDAPAARQVPATERARGDRATAPRRGELWYLLPDGRLGSKVVRVGLSDGQNTEIAGSGITEGMQVVAAVIDGGTTTTSATSANPFQQTRQRAPGGGPPPGP